MAQFLDAMVVPLRALSLSFEALTLGGVLFVFLIARHATSEHAYTRIFRWLVISSVSLALANVGMAAVNSTNLMISTNLRLIDLLGAGYFISAGLVTAGAASVALSATKRARIFVFPLAFALILAGSLMASHSVSRVENRWALMSLTLAHHLSAAAWIGGIPYLLISLRHTKNPKSAVRITSNFSRLAIASVTLLLASGAALAFWFVRSPGLLIETNYGIMVLVKVTLTALLLVLGLLNFRIVRAVRSGVQPDLLPLRRFAEAELGIGLTVVMAAASLTSTPPAIDIQAARVPLHDIAERLKPEWPRMSSPAFADLSKATPLSEQAVKAFQPALPQKPADIAWSEYNHHWAGLVVLVAGVLALLSRFVPVARHWPLAFLGLAAFLFLRADSENWPLGPRSFWGSFQVPEVAQHRFFVLLIVLFAIFEWAVQTERLSAIRAGLVFPFVCAVGGAVLLTHSHSLGNVKDELLVEMSHAPLAIAGVTAGWSRWLDVRLSDKGPRAIRWIWPSCLVLMGVILILYRES